MGTNGEKPAILAEVDQILNNTDLKNEPRSVLLFHVYKLVEIFYPELADSYRIQLSKISSSLPAGVLEEFNKIGYSAKKKVPLKKGKFELMILGAIDEAKSIRAADQSRSREIFMDCITKINKRWWSSKRKELWPVLIPELFLTDRHEALKLLTKLPPNTWQDQILVWNTSFILKPEEWDKLMKIVGDDQVKSIQKTILGQEDIIMDISENMIISLGLKLIEDMFYRLQGEVTEAQLTSAENRRENGQELFIKLIKFVHIDHPVQVKILLESWGEKIMKHEIYRKEKNWVNRITDLREFLNLCLTVADDTENITTFLKNKTPDYLKKFTLAHWYAITSDSEEDAEKAFYKLAEDPRDKMSSQAWFLIILILTGKGFLAYKLSRESSWPEELTPRVLRQWIVNNSDDVRENLKKEELPRDLISQFFLLPTLDEQMEFLREKTHYGKSPLPEEMWRLPDCNKLNQIMESEDFVPLYFAEHLYTNFYFTSLSSNKQIIAYIKQFGFGQYTYDETYKELQRALNYWDSIYPEEVSALLAKMWNDFKPNSSIIQYDVVRNSVFEYYRNIFAVRPEILQSFTGWIKKEFVNSSRQWTIGDTTYTFSLKSTAPFIYCLQAAMNIGNISSAKCDQILIDAVKNYVPDHDLMNSAAELYASDKDIVPIAPPCQIHPSYYLTDWQMGVIESYKKRITNRLLSDLKESRQEE